MVILRRQELSSSVLNVEDVSSVYSRTEPRTSSLQAECSNSSAVMQEEDKSHPSSND